MKTLDLESLMTVTGGVGPASRCNRAQFDWMASHMVPDGSLRPGVQRHVVVNDARSCGFPMPRR
jgi:hypothetical protein